jgi:D-proline reductase (dithiol) PrdB
MADLSDLPLRLRAFLKIYQWRRIDPVPWSPMKKPLTRANVAIVSSAGMVERNQVPFDDEKRGGDTTYREIPDGIEVSSLIDTHRSESFDHRGIQSDPNLAFPLDRLHELRDSGIVGAVNHRHFSFMGSITAPGRLIAESAPDAAQKLASDGVDAVLLVPV